MLESCNAICISQAHLLSGTYWSATSDEDETGYVFIFTHRYVNQREEDYYWGTPIRAVFSID